MTKNKTLIAGNDDARGQDSYLRWQVPEDGNYYIRITDHLGQGGDTYVYRVEMTPVKPVLTIGIPRVERYVANAANRRRSARQSLRRDHPCHPRRFRRPH